MTRSLSALSPYYRIELAPQAWKEVGCVAAVDFQVLQDVMELLAVEGTPYEQGQGPHALTVAGFEVLYTRDDEERVLTLHRVRRAAQQPGKTG
ncbi:MAG: hypothetical protein ACJ8AT_05575 [Hyalangium sp.]|uniref:hypothetical protein n=1 Tax=Hyalangium sp. TaxID=2028555 RepID=UPI00389B3747